MKTLFTVLLLISFSAFAQPTATITGSPAVCQTTPSTVTFTGGNGTAPYTFTYTVDGGSPQTITTMSGNSINLDLTNFIPGNFVYTLISVEDVTTAFSTLNSSVIQVVNPIPIISAGPDQTVCLGTAVTVSGSGGITYNWNNGIINSTPFFPTVGTMILTVTGMSTFGCIAQDQVIITTLPIPLDPGASIDSAFCNNGAISIIQGPQTAGYTFMWSNGSTTSNLTGLSAGPYICYMYDPNGCSNQFTYVVPNTVLPTNCAQINGSVYFDNDENCSIGAGDYPVANRILIATPGNYLAVTDQNGDYTFQLPTGSYVVSEIFNSSNYGNYCNLNYSVTLNNPTDISSNNDFLDTLNGEIDLQATIYATSVVPGFGFIVQPTYYSMNVAGSLLNTNAWFTIPPGVTMQGWAYPHTISNDTVYFTINTPQSFVNSIPFYAPANLPLGSSLSFCAGIEIQPSETIILNNSYCHTLTVIGSFDPNDKTMFLNGIQSDSTILLTDQSLDYVIRFQNTGTAPAHDIYILDTIQSTLDLSSIKFIAASHTCSVSILDGNILKFNFSNIMLPDSTNNEPESHGFVHYRIQQNNQNTVGTIINNTAYIYFDFNEAVVTNTTHDSIIIDDLGIEDEQLFAVSIYPNPSEAVVTIESDILIETIEITDLNGQFINGYFSNSYSTSLDLSYLTSGIYFIQMNAKGGSVMKRIIIQ